MATGYLTSALRAFEQGSPDEILQHILLVSNKAANYFTLTPGVKGIKRISLTVDASMDVSTGKMMNPYSSGSGGVTFKDVTLYNVPIKFREVYRDEDLDRKLISYATKKGIEDGDLQAADVISALKERELIKNNELYIWADASTILPSGGIKKQLLDASTFVRSTYPAYDFNTVSDASVRLYVDDITYKIRTSLPQYTMEPMILAMSPAQFIRYVNALYGLNSQVTRDTLTDAKPEVTIPSSGNMVKAVPFPGLIGDYTLICATEENVSINVDQDNPAEKIEFFRSREFGPGDNAILQGQYWLGVTVIDPTKCIMSNI